MMILLRLLYVHAAVGFNHLSPIAVGLNHLPPAVGLPLHVLAAVGLTHLPAAAGGPHIHDLVAVSLTFM